MRGYRAAVRRWTYRVGAGLVCVFVAGCISTESHCGIELAEAIDRAEHRGLASRGTADPAPRPPGRRDTAETPARAVTPQELSAVHGVVRQATDLLGRIDRVAALGGAARDSRDRLARSLAIQAARTASELSIDAPVPVRTNFVRSSDEIAAPLAVLTLSEMAGASGEPGRSREAGASAVPMGAARGPRGPLPGFGETAWRDLKRIHLDLWEDTKKVYTDPTNVVILITTGATSLALRPEVDDDIEDYYRDHHTMSEGWRDTFGVLGNPAFHFALAGAWYLAGQQAQHTKTYEVGKTLLSALIINGVSTSALKLAACTDSPNGEAFAWPSGHTSSAFTMAAVMHQAYGHWAGIPLYGVAGMVGLARLDDREHHLSDVVFGAAMGLVIGHTVASGHRPKIFGGELIPYADPTTGSGGLAWFKTSK